MKAQPDMETIYTQISAWHEEVRNAEHALNARELFHFQKAMNKTQQAFEQLKVVFRSNPNTASCLDKECRDLLEDGCHIYSEMTKQAVEWQKDLKTRAINKQRARIIDATYTASRSAVPGRHVKIAASGQK